MQFEIRKYTDADLELLKTICIKAFTPIFDGFRETLGEDIFNHRHTDWKKEQLDYLQSICKADSDKDVYVLEGGGAVIGFMGLGLDHATKIGTIDLNAVDSDFQGKGGGQFMYAFAHER